VDTGVLAKSGAETGTQLLTFSTATYGTITKIELMCIEATTDINSLSNNVAVGLRTSPNINQGTDLSSEPNTREIVQESEYRVGEMVIHDTMADAANQTDSLYITGSADNVGALTAGKFLVKIYGVTGF
jgi:hypothetical protein